MNDAKISPQNKRMDKFMNEKTNFGADLIFSLPGNIIFINRNHEIVMCNEGALDFFGCKNEMDLAKNFFHLSPDVQSDGRLSKEKYDFVIEQAFSNGKYETLWTHINTSGELTTFHISLVTASGIENSGEQYVIAVLHDVSSYIAEKEKERNQNAKVQAVLDGTPFAINLWDKNMNNIMCNSRAVSLFGLSDKEQYLKEFFRFSPEYQPTGEKSVTMAKRNFAKAFDEGHGEFYWLHQDINGEEIPAEIILTRTEIEGEEFMVGIIRDLRAEFTESHNSYKYESYFLDRISDKTLVKEFSELSTEWFFALDVRTSKIKYFGKTVADLANINVFDPTVTVEQHGIVHEDDKELYNKLQDNLSKGIYEPFDIRYLQGDGEYRYFRSIYRAIHNSDGNPIFVVGKALDVHEQRILEERSKVDLLTECYNKISGETIVAEKLRTNKDNQHALFVIDIDNFKAINDNLGHFYGDMVLKEISAALKSAFRSADMIARIGGDEFIVFAENVANTKILENKAKKVLEAFRRTYSGGGQSYSISGSVGIATYPENGTSFYDLYKAADKALYQAKLLGKNRYVFYDNALSDGRMLDTTKIENANRMAGTYFDYDLISTTFEILYERNADDVSINYVLQHLAKKYNTDRAYIFETHDGGVTYDNTYEWVAEGISSEIDGLKDIPAEVFDDFFVNSVNNIVYSNDLEASFQTEGTYEIMASQNIKSFAHAQAWKDGKMSTFLGLDDCTHKRVWSEKELNSLLYISKNLSLVLQSRHLQDKLKAMNEYDQLTAHIANLSTSSIYLSDLDTYELLYVNKALIDTLGFKDESDWKGKPCYKLLQGKDAPCEFCTNHLLNDKEFYEWTHFNPSLDATFLVRDKLVLHEGKLVRLESATDVTKLKALESDYKDKLEDEKLVLACVDILRFSEDPKESINKLLSTLADFYKADRAYIFELSEDDAFLQNTYEWCGDGVTAHINNLQNLPKEVAGRWFAKYEEVGEFYFDMSNDEFNENSIVYEILQVLGITSVATAPIRGVDGKITGFFGVDDPKENKNNTAPLRALSKFIADFIKKNETFETLQLLKAELSEKLAEQILLTKCAETLSTSIEPNSSINDLLGMIASFYQAERSYIFDVVYSEGKIVNTYEWCAEGIESQIDNLQAIPIEAANSWFIKFEEVGEFYINSLTDDLSPGSPDYETLEMQGITSLVAAPLRDAEGKATGFIGVDNPKESMQKAAFLRALSKFIASFLDKNKLLGELHQLGYYDTLTGLKNRESYRKALDELDGDLLSSLGVAYVNIQGMKLINDTKGMEFGDEVIKRLSVILQEIFADDVYHVGGDEFIVLRKNAKEQVFESNIGYLKTKLSTEENFKASVGFAWNKSFDDAFDENTETIKMSTRNKRYSAILLKNLEKEIENGKFAVYLQPQIDMQTGKVNSAEALVRRISADGKLQPPIAFIPFYEKESMIFKIDFFVFETVCKLLEGWNENRPEKDFMISVNFSRNTMSEKEIAKKLNEICEKYDVKKSQIVIEVTETINGIGDDTLSEIIKEFSSLGFCISLDDFGSGYSNLSALKLTVYDELKLDMSLVCDVHDDEKSQMIIKSTLDLCKELKNLTSVAEGIETQEQYEILKNLHCDKGQGYFFGKPMPITEFEERYVVAQ